MNKIADFAKIITKGTTPSTIGGDFIDEGINFIKVESITSTGTLEKNSLQKISDSINKKMKRSQLQENDLLITIAGALGRAYVVEKEVLPANTNQAVGIIRLNLNKCNPSYLKYWLRTPWIQKLIDNINAQSIQNNLNLVNVGDIPLNNNDIKEQQKIVSVLSVLDSKIELNNKINAELEQMAKTLYDYWFVQFDFPNKNGKPYKTNGGKMVWNKELKRDIPKEWTFDTIGSRAKTHLGGTPSRANKEYWNNGSIPWLSSGEIVEFPIFCSVEKITEKGLKNSAAKLLKIGSIMISITGNIRVSILGIEASANQSVVGVEEGDELKKSYLYFLILNHVSQYEALMAGAVQKHINKNVVGSTLILIPHKKILNNYYKLVDPMLEKIMIFSRENQKLAELRDWLLPMLMNGQVTVK